MKDPQAHLGRAVVGALALSLAVPAEAYVGPGAGFALLSSFAVVLTTLVLAAAAILLWPFRTVYRRLSRGKPAA
jgi:protein-S-isoprenylcysteine O-methyltransferase Ste14